MQYDEVQGSTDLMMRLVNGEWKDKDFLVMRPGKMAEASHDGNIVRTKDKEPCCGRRAKAGCEPPV